MVIENLILPPRHASHRGSALLTIHPFSNLRVFRPLTRRLDRPPLSSPTILQPSVREREREREKREERRAVVVVGGKKGRAHASQIACLACAVLPGRFQGGPGSQRWKRASRRPMRRVPPANAARPAGQRGASRRPMRRVPPANAARPTGQRGASHRPTRRAATENNPVLPFARGFCADATPCFRRGHKAATYIQLQLFLQRKTAPSPEVAAGLL